MRASNDVNTWDNSLYDEVGLLRSNVEQLMSQAKQTNGLLQQLLMATRPIGSDGRIVFAPGIPRWSPPKEPETEEGLIQAQVEWDAQQDFGNVNHRQDND